MKKISVIERSDVVTVAIIDENSELPSLFNMFLTPDIYLPILALIIFLILAFIMRKIFFKN